MSREVVCSSCGRSNPDDVRFCHGCGNRLGSSPPPPERAPEPSGDLPTSFDGGRYQIQKFLGEGGKKRVYLAHDTTLDRDVAFALIKTEGLDDAGRERISREAQAMGRLGAALAHSHRLRPGTGGRRSLHGHRADGRWRRGRGAGSRRRRPHPAGTGNRHRPCRMPGPGVRPQPGHSPPRPKAGQRLAQRGRRRQDRRLWGWRWPSTGRA